MIIAILAKLLVNDAQTHALLRTNPFSDRPPRFVRATMYLYRVARRGSGARPERGGFAGVSASTWRRCRTYGPRAWVG